MSYSTVSTSLLTMDAPKQTDAEVPVVGVLGPLKQSIAINQVETAGMTIKVVAMTPTEDDLHLLCRYPASIAMCPGKSLLLFSSTLSWIR